VDVFSVDAAGNVGGNASRVTWTWDRSAPETVVSVEGGVWLPALNAWLVNNASVTVVLSSSETVSMFNVSVDGVVHSVVNSSTLQLVGLATGRHVIAATAVDVAGNVDGSAATVTVLVDVTAPPPPRFELLYERGCFVLPRSPVYVCNSSDALAFEAACSEAGSSDTAPCFVEWRVDAVSVSGGSGGGCVVVGANATSGGSWTRAVGPLVQPRPTLDGQYRVWWRAVDGAGNAGAADSMLVWLDTTPPSKEPTFVVTPGLTSFSVTARFEVKVEGDMSFLPLDAGKGQLSVRQKKKQRQQQQQLNKAVAAAKQRCGHRR
jgi:hypothetical protein